MVLVVVVCKNLLGMVRIQRRRENRIAENSEGTIKNLNL